MKRGPFGPLVSRAVVLLRDDVDTDQIIPARFLTTTTREGLGRHLFADWRYGAEGAPRPDFPLNASDAAPARILVAGRNFGCGSSREHAPWALLDWGFRAVIATSFADIFRSNAHRNGLLAVALGPDAHAGLLRALDHVRDAELYVSLKHQRVSVGEAFRAHFEIDAFEKQCLTDGVDELAYLLAKADAIAAFEKVMAPLVATNLPLAGATRP